jgi:two-component SAPR family response regulator
MGQKIILIVENNKLIALDLKMICKDLGYECHSAAYNKDTLNRINALSPDLVLMDIKLDKTQNIIDEAERICDEFNIPIIFFTTAPRESYQNNRLQNRCLFQPIPFTTEEIVEAIEKIFKMFPSHREQPN